jgi:hypothetical protein
MTAHVPEKNRAAPPATKAPAVDTATAATAETAAAHG